MPIDLEHNWTCLTPEAGHYTFGYYDRCPWDAGIRNHLALRIPQQDRLPEPGETAEVGFVDRDERVFRKVADTLAWCHQQGAMTLWLAHEQQTFIYNDFARDGDAWRPICRRYSLTDGGAGEYDTHIYTMSPDGRYGAALNIGRIPRRGYSYALAPLPEGRPPDMDEDGLFVVDMHTGDKRLVASYRQLIAKHPIPHDLEGHYSWLNHSIFNSDSSRVMVLFRHSEKPWGWPWKTHLYTVGVDGSDLRCSLPDIYWRNGSISHQIWGMEPDDLLVDANWCDRGHEYVLVKDACPPGPARRVSPGMGPHSHLVYSPNGKWIAADTYPGEDDIQRLALVDAQKGAITEIGRFKHSPNWLDNPAVRCDLHPRWSPDSRFLTVDTVNDGERKIYMVDAYEMNR